MTPGRLLLLMLVGEMLMEMMVAGERMDYSIKIFTSNIQHASSDAKGSLRLYGSKGKNIKLILPQGNTKGSRFVRNELYEKRFVNELDVGEIYKVQLWHDGAGFGDGWNVKHLLVIQMKGQLVRNILVDFNDKEITTSPMYGYPNKFWATDQKTKIKLSCDTSSWQIECPTHKRIQIKSARHERLKKGRFCSGSTMQCIQPPEYLEKQKKVIQQECDGEVKCKGRTDRRYFDQFKANYCTYPVDNYLRIEYTCQDSVPGKDKSGCVKSFDGFCDKKKEEIDKYRIGEKKSDYTLQDCHTECAKTHLCEAFAHINAPTGDCYLFKAGCGRSAGTAYLADVDDIIIPRNSEFYEMRSCSRGFIHGEPDIKMNKCGETLKHDCEVATYNYKKNNYNKESYNSNEDHYPKSCCKYSRCHFCSEQTTTGRYFDYRTYYQVVTNPRPGDSVTRGPDWTDGDKSCDAAVDPSTISDDKMEKKNEKSKKVAKTLLKDKNGKALKAASNKKEVPQKRDTRSIKSAHTNNTPQHMKRAINNTSNYMKRDGSVCDAKKATGTIIANNGDQTVEVEWDYAGYVGTYSVGRGGEYNLYYDGNQLQYSCEWNVKGHVWEEDPGTTNANNLRNNGKGRFRGDSNNDDLTKLMKTDFKPIRSKEMCIRKCYLDPEVLWDTVIWNKQVCSCYFRENDDSMLDWSNEAEKLGSYSCKLRRGGQMTEIKLMKCSGDDGCNSMIDVPKSSGDDTIEERKGYVYTRNGDSSAWKPICADTENTGAHSVVASLMCRQIYNEHHTSGEYLNIDGEFKQPTDEIEKSEMTNVMCTENAPISVSQRFMDCKWETQGQKKCKNGLVYVQCTKCDKAKYLALMRELADEFEILMIGAQEKKVENEANENDKMMVDKTVVSQKFMESKNQDLGKAVIIILKTKLKKLANECYDWACDYPQEITGFHCRFKSWMMALKESMAPSSTDMGIILANREHRELLKHDFALQNFKNIGNEVKEFRKSIGSYFAQLATFDLSKAEQDKGYVQGTINKIQEKMTTTFKELSGFLETAISQAQIKAAVTVQQESKKMVLMLVKLGNPFEWVAGDPLDALESADDVAVAIKKSKLVANVATAIRKLGSLFLKIQNKMVENKGYHDKFLNLIDKNQDIASEEMVEISKQFTDAYGDYSPGLTPELVTEYITKLELFAEMICDEGEADSAETIVVETINTAIRGKPCFKDMHVTIAKMIAFLEQMMDLQDDMMDAGADMARALIARSEAKRIIGDTDAESNQNVLYKVFDFVPVGLLKWEPYLRAYTHRRELVATMCHEMKYRNFGNTPDYCKNLLNNPVPEDISQLISWKYIEPVCSTRVISIHGYANETSALPLTLKEPFAKGIEHEINVKALYKTGEATFEIMDVKTAREMGWIDPSSDGVGVYVKQFALYLPPEEDDKQSGNMDGWNPSYKVEVDIFKSGGENFLKPLPKKREEEYYVTKRKEKFLLPHNVLKTVYKINEYPCRNMMDFDPYQTPNCPSPTRYGTCKEQEGTSQSDILPSLFGQWQIRLVNNHPDYMKQMKDVKPPMRKLGALSPDSLGVQLQAHVTVCESPEKPDTEKPKADDSTETGELKRRHSIEEKKDEKTGKKREETGGKDSNRVCCGSDADGKKTGNVWVIDPETLKESCDACEDAAYGATPAIGGYYCKLTDPKILEIRKKKKNANRKQSKTERTS